MRARRHLDDVGRHPSILAIGASFLVLLAAPGAGMGPPQGLASPAGHDSVAFREGSLSSSAARKASTAWQGGRVTSSRGEQLTVFVSNAYGVDQVQRWADFFSALPHGTELGLLTAYVAPLEEVEAMCGGDALGCYWSNRLVTIGGAVYSVSAEEVATHEYGHHIAFNRDNAPWLAVDWGTKRWASYTNICARQKAGSVYPGDEDAWYRLNPGEAFAEVYRVLVETKSGTSAFTWSLVDSSFLPDAGALRAAEEDVVKPWSAPSPTQVAARFRAKGPKTWTRKVATPLDGVFNLRLTMPQGALYDATVLGADGKTVMARTLWSGTGEKSATFQVCGERSLMIRVVRRGAPGRFSLAFARP
jgi:hypothetical protein